MPKVQRRAGQRHFIVRSQASSGVLTVETVAFSAIEGLRATYPDMLDRVRRAL
jgi:hypothetical protein